MRYYIIVICLVVLGLCNSVGGCWVNSAQNKTLINLISDVKYSQELEKSQAEQHRREQLEAKMLQMEVSKLKAEARERDRAILKLMDAMREVTEMMEKHDLLPQPKRKGPMT